MSEVKHYFWVQDGMSEGGKSLDTYVKSQDFDRVTAELQRQLDHKDQQRESELRNGQAGDRLVGELQQRLTAADERVDVLEGLLRNLDDAWNSHDGRVLFGKLMHRVEAALKPAEVSDEPCEFCKGWGFRANSETGADEGCGACNGTGSTPSEDQP